MQITGNYAAPLISAVQNRIGEPLGDRFEIKDWEEVADMVEESAEKALKRRRERLVGANGQIAGDIDNLIPSAVNDTTKAQLLLTLAQGSRTVF